MNVIILFDNDIDKNIVGVYSTSNREDFRTALTEKLGEYSEEHEVIS